MFLKVNLKITNLKMKTLFYMERIREIRLSLSTLNFYYWTQ